LLKLQKEYIFFIFNCCPDNGSTQTEQLLDLSHPHICSKLQACARLAHKISDDSTVKKINILV